MVTAAPRGTGFGDTVRVAVVPLPPLPPPPGLPAMPPLAARADPAPSVAPRIATTTSIAKMRDMVTILFCFMISPPLLKQSPAENVTDYMTRYVHSLWTLGGVL